MFVIMMLIIIYLCLMSIVLVMKYLDLQKDIETLYDNYSSVLYKSYGLKGD